MMILDTPKLSMLTHLTYDKDHNPCFNNHAF
jgi:hypothetical protein